MHTCTVFHEGDNLILDFSVMDQYFCVTLKMYNKKAVSELKSFIF